MKPSKVWQENRFRIDLRQETRKFEKRFKLKSKSVIEPGKVYAMRYLPDNNIITDKFHITPVILALGHYVNDGRIYVKGINIFYLSTQHALNVLEDAFLSITKKPITRNLHINTIHDKYINTLDYNYKNFDVDRIVSYSEIEPEIWGLIPLLHKNLFGNFNIEALIKDYKKENKVVKKQPRKIKKETKSETKGETVSEVITNEQPLTMREVFED
jgi:hypothetical protein